MNRGGWGSTKYHQKVIFASCLKPQPKEMLNDRRLFLPPRTEKGNSQEFRKVE
jgi:hypothetical protein